MTSRSSRNSGGSLWSSAARGVGLLVVSALLHVLFGVSVFGLGRLLGNVGPAEDSGDDIVEIAVVEQQPASEPEPKPQPPPKPEKPEPKPEPDPAPEKPPPESPEKPDPPEKTPESEKPAPEPDTPEKAEKPPEKEPVDDPVDLQGLEMESTVEGGEGPTMKVGKGIGSGEVTDEYVDPDGLDQSGGGGGGVGNPGGSGGRGGSGSGCPQTDAKLVSKERVSESEYPLAAKRRGIEGTVVGVATIDENGRVTDVKIVQSLGHGFDELATEAFKQWRFEPARRNCRAVSIKKRLSHRFSLTE